MKVKDAMEVKILLEGNEPIVEWLQSMQFRSKIILFEEKGLKETKSKVNEAQNRGFELIRELHTDS